jgi:hypothetical protein
MDNIFFNDDGVIQVTDFCMNNLRSLEGKSCVGMDIDAFSKQSWTPKADIRAFGEILSEIVGAQRSIPSLFAVEMIQVCQSAFSNGSNSFSKILNDLKKQHFQIVAGVDIPEVSGFVSRVESSERFIP